MNKERELELVLEQCREVVDRKIPLLELAPEYTKILLDYIEELKESLHQASIGIQELIEQDIECPTTCEKLKQENEKLNHYKLLYQKVKDRNDKAIEFIESKNNGICIVNGEEKGTYTFLLDFDKSREFVWSLLDILKGNNDGNTSN